MTGWVLDEFSCLKREVNPRMGRRLRGWDYKRPGYYVITIVKADRRSNDFKLKVNFRFAPKEQAGRESSEVQLAPTAPAVGWFSAIGNHFLLKRHSFHQIQCSRRFFAYQRDGRGNLIKDAPPALVTSEFEDRLSSAFDATQKGAVLISPCISQGEREIARRAFKAGYSVITLANKGFSSLYKPGGKLFETCANGKLLMLAPIGWPHQVAEKPITRIDALILNRIAQLIAGDGAAKIDYKDVSMTGIDEEVLEVTSLRE